MPVIICIDISGYSFSDVGSRCADVKIFDKGKLVNLAIDSNLRGVSPAASKGRSYRLLTPIVCVLTDNHYQYTKRLSTQFARVAGQGLDSVVAELESEGPEQLKSRMVYG